MSLLALDGPSVDGDLYTWLTGVALRAPSWLDTLISTWSTHGLALFAVLMLLGWWRARKAGDPQATATALSAPLVVCAAFLVDTAIKSLVQEQRPCQSLHTVTLEACPPPGDWSFPSNHAAIAAAAATALWLVDRRLATIAAPAALLMAVSRVWVGAHYPHDVLLGLAVGVCVAWPLTRTTRHAAPLVKRLGSTPLRRLVTPR